MKIARSGSDSDSDPHRNLMHPQHWQEVRLVLDGGMSIKFRMAVSAFTGRMVGSEPCRGCKG
jgi:hypothetical protein